MSRNLERVLTVAQVAELCQVAATTVRNWIKDGKLEAYSLPGGHYRVKESVLTRFMSAFGIPIPEMLRVRWDNGRTRVLVIDDEPAFCRLVTEVLTHNEGEYEVATASNGTEGTLLAWRLKPDIIVLDVMMPGVNGAEVCRAIRGVEELSDTKVLLVTGQEGAPEVEEALEEGADGCLFKPIDPEELLRAIHGLQPSRLGESLG